MRLKKTCVWFILLLSFQAAIIRAQSSWSDPILVVWANNPDLAIDRQRGLIHVVGLNNGVRYAVLDTLGNVQTEYKVPKSGTDYGRMNFGVSIDVDSQGFPHVVSVPSPRNPSQKKTASISFSTPDPNPTR